MGDNDKHLFVDSPEFIKEIQKELNDFPEWIKFIDNNGNNLDNILNEYILFMFNKNIDLNNGIKLVWKIHKLHPCQYKRDCFRCFGKVIKSHKFDLSFDKNEETRYDTGKTLDDTVIFVDRDELKKSVTKQYDFMKKMVDINVDGYDAEQSIKEYKEFMGKIGATDEIVVPSLNVDLVWHTHMISDLYFDESIILSKGKFVMHDDLLDDHFLVKQWNKQLNDNKSIITLFILILISLVTIYLASYQNIFTLLKNAYSLGNANVMTGFIPGWASALIILGLIVCVVLHIKCCPSSGRGGGGGGGGCGGGG